MPPKEARGEASSPRLKLVIRRLPPTLPAEVFWKSVAPWVAEETCTWKRYIAGRPSISQYDHAVHSRAYCLMNNVEALAAFHRGFAGHVFRSKTGVEYQVVVEYAPMQKTPPRAKPKADARQGTIDDDPDYKSYLESLQAPIERPVLEPSVPNSQPTSTPLLEYLRLQSIPGFKSGKKKQKPDSSSTDVARNAAVAAVTASAAKRTSKDQGVMIAGKGRAVVVAPIKETPAKSASSEKPVGKSRNRKPKAAKGGPPTDNIPPPSITPTNFPALGDHSAIPSTSSSRLPPLSVNKLDGGGVASVPGRGAGHGALPREGGRGRGGASRGASSRGRGVTANAAREGGAAERGGARGAIVNAPDQVANSDLGGSSQTTPGRGRGRGKGRGGGETRDNTARETVTGILTRDPATGKSSVPTPRLARIDA